MQSTKWIFVQNICSCIVDYKLRTKIINIFLNIFYSDNKVIVCCSVG